MIATEKRVLVCGGRDYADQETVFAWLSPMRTQIAVLIEGGARGADSLARHWAVMNDVPVETYRAEWEKHGRSAGAIRNRRMLEEGKPDLVVAFPGGRGTADMVRVAQAAGVDVILVS